MGEINFNLLKKKISKEAFEKIKSNYNSLFINKKVIKSNKLFEIKWDNYKIWLNEGTSSAEIMTFFEMFKANNHHKIKNFTGKFDKIVLDIGANEGYYTLKMKKNNPKLEIISFEPMPMTFAMLKKNIESNKLKDVFLVNKAIGLSNQKIEFEYVPEATAISSNKIDLSVRPWLKKERIKKLKVDCVNLKWIFERFNLKYVDIMKIDTEGAELDILNGGGDVLGKIRKIVIEYHSDKLKRDCIKFLKKRGFKLVKEEKRVCGDIYFVNEVLK